MNELQMFNNSEFGQVRVLEIDNDGWLIGKDVASVLGYSNPQKAIRDHVDEEDKRTERIVHPSGGRQATVIINESGLYSLVMSSKLPTAKKFRRWVTSEVLPAIRKTGQYTMSTGHDYYESTASRLRAEARANYSRVALSAEIRKLIELSSVQLHRNVLVVHAANILAQKEILELPKIEKSYSANEVGAQLGISANKVGRIANELKLKAEAGSENQYGHYVADVASSNKQKDVEVWRYSVAGVEAIREHLKQSVL